MVSEITVNNWFNLHSYIDTIKKRWKSGKDMCLAFTDSGKAHNNINKKFGKHCKGQMPLQN
jgi:hypothetical protein